MTDDYDHPEAIIERYWPYDGPHSPDSVHAAMIAVGYLLRYVNNATGPWNAKSTLPYAASADRVIGFVASSVHHLPQLLSQLEQFIEDQAGDPSLYDDRRDRPGSVTARELVDELQQARRDVAALADRLSNAAALSSHLGNDD